NKIKSGTISRKEKWEMVKLVKNEAHTVKEQQWEVLEKTLGIRREEVNIVNIPAKGIDSAKQRELAEKLVNEGGIIVFLSPVPVLLAQVAFLIGKMEENKAVKSLKLLIFSRDVREKKEENGVIEMKVAEEGWTLEEIG